MGNYCCNINNAYELIYKPTYDSYDILMKLPHGKTCYYIKHKDKKWSQNDDINAVIKSLYTMKLDNWIVYNDETSTSCCSNGAHAKGILAWNDKTITWLIHSVPKFPEKFDGTNNFPDIDNSELIYGQSFIFIKIDIEHLENILTQLFITHPNVYISNYDYEKYKNAHKLMNSNIYKINDKLTHVSKSPDYHKDLYTDIVIPNFGGNCLTETWVRGHHCDETENCKMISKIEWPNSISYTYTHDHSKYCYSDNGWILIGDMNRMTSQFKRGGGGIVVKDKDKCKLFKDVIRDS
jgi:deoxyribonuclease-2